MRASALAPFGVRSFRFQWPAGLATSWAFEMEALILGWYVLTATGSVQQLVVFGALAWLGSLFSPLFGVVGDRVGHCTLLCATRGVYALLAGLLIAHLGFASASLLYAGLGLAATFAFAWRWRRALWRRSAPANARA